MAADSARGDSRPAEQGPAGGPTPPQAEAEFDPKQWLSHTTAEVRDGFEKNRLLMSFGEYFSLFAAAPARHARSAAQYLRDVFDHFGT